jgi:hypothetical protein
MKDRFDRTDPAWEEMVGIVRGAGPLQPQKAASLGYGQNDSPLYKLYQAFRRSSPKSRVAGGWADVLVVRDNDRAEEMAKKYHEGVAEYLPDTMWWDLVQEEDNRLLTPQGRPATGSAGATAAGQTGGNLSGFGAGAGTAVAPGSGLAGSTSPAMQQARAAGPARTVIPSLSREYRHDVTHLRWDVKAFAAVTGDPDLEPAGAPWMLRRMPDGSNLFLINRSHPIFRSATMTELDALLCELAQKAADFTRGNQSPPAFCSILADLRETYGGTLKLDGTAVLSAAEQTFRAIARAWYDGLVALELNQLYADMPSSDREAIQHRMAARAVANPQQVVADGRFLEYAPPRVLLNFVRTHPEHFFDGRCWEEPYATLDFSYPTATEQARQRVLAKYEALLTDAVWVSELDAVDIDAAPRENILRATLAIDLLTPTPSASEL